MHRLSLALILVKVVSGVPSYFLRRRDGKVRYA